MFRSASPEDNNIGTDPFRDQDRGRLKFGFLYRSLKCEDKREEADPDYTDYTDYELRGG